METTLATFTIRTVDFSRFEREFAQLVKKARKLKVQDPTFKIIETKVIPAVISMGEVSRPGFEVKVVQVSGQAPKLAGWSFVAVLQHEEVGNIIRRVPGTEDLKVALDMRTATPYCGHCKTARRRNDTYVVAHDDGRQLQIGRNCLKDFTGHDSPESIARWAELLAAFQEAENDCWDEEGGFGGGRGEHHAEISSYLAYVACAIRVTGEWLSRTKAREFDGSRTATADVAWNLNFPTKQLEEEYKKRGESVPSPTEVDIARAARALEVANTHFETEEAAGRELGDYEHNLRITIECKSVSQRSSGIAASIVSFAERLIGQEMERRKAATSEFQGEVGKRGEFVLSVIRVVDITSDLYGTSHLHLMQDAAGNRFTWKTSSKCLTVGSTYKVKGSVKKHDVYQRDPKFPAVKQTVLLRCKVEEVKAD